MEVRDVIPSQNQFAMQRNVEAPKRNEVSNEKFKDLMSQKFSDYSRRRDFSQKMKKSSSKEELATSESVKKSHQKTEPAAGQNPAEETKVVQVKMNSETELSESPVSAENPGAVSVLPVGADAETQEIQEAASLDEEMSEKPAEQSEEPLYIAATVPVEVSAEDSAVVANDGDKTEGKAVAGLAVRANRAGVKQVYELHDAAAAKEYAEMLEVLATDFSKSTGASREDNTDVEFPNAEVKADAESKTPDTEAEVRSGDAVNFKEKPELIKAERKIGAADREALEHKTKQDSDSNSGHGLSSEAFLTKTEAVRHHDNMMSAAPRTVMKQVADAIAVDVKVLSDGKALEIKLSPEHLGKVTMKIEMKDGRMVANIKVENAEVKNALEASLQELRESLS